MKLLSFDVGIKNLSFCIIEYINNEINIQKWEVIDLCNERIKCIEIKNSKTCDKIAKYCKNNEYYCQTHCKNKCFEIPPDNLREKILKKMKLDELIHLVKTLNIGDATMNIKHKTKNKLLELIADYKSNKYFDIVETIKAQDYNLIELGINLKDKLDTLLFSNNSHNSHNSHNLDLELDLDLDLVLIENQISPIANRMKTIQGMIAQYLIMKGVHNIIFYSACHKLNTFIGKEKTSYSERKGLSVNYATQILTKNNTLTQQWLNYFLASKKKDDLADSFLQGLSYLINNYNFNVNI